ncbi:MAG TPA: phosphatase PAP2 family protein [Prolixibacteraceae bacterium]|nr:phosphatase PAP2 family protein [Prolixibacteraceae bacterium]HOS00791.1 phosphatase PAP2 family protein [Prolixibacteraceae bacterium]HOS90858.1 phosphatase PAP2 family protein [Prolixibacteraceae bacterium]HPL45950.1 phosphatase PAP2 family protein [Prolixibacteraceae bacterium]HQE52728.1 phosphatase PAP2 family protein [Prolixibacteraceae bacterium]
MEWIESLLYFDEQLFLRLNGINSPWWDTAMLFITRKESWLPLYITVIWLIIRTYGKQSWFVLAFLVMGLVVSDQGTGILKEIVERARPGYDPDTAPLTHIVIHKGGEFGFPSSHASNTFFLLTFTALLFRNRYTFMIFLVWALLVSYSRIYTGVHFPLDIAGGWIFGIFTGWFFYRLLSWGASRRGGRKTIGKKALPGKHALIAAVVFFTVSMTLLTMVFLLHKYDFL